MTFKEAVDRLREMGLHYCTAQYEHKFHAKDWETAECLLYSERNGGVIGRGKTWEAAFASLENQLGLIIPTGVEAPDHDVTDTESAPAKEDSDVPF